MMSFRGCGRGGDGGRDEEVSGEVEEEAEKEEGSYEAVMNPRLGGGFRGQGQPTLLPLGKFQLQALSSFQLEPNLAGVGAAY